MDSREPPHSPHPYQLQPKNIVPVGPNPFTNTSPITMITPTTAQFPLSNINTNPLPQYEHLSLTLSVGASSSGSGSFKRKRGRPRKYFPNSKVTLGSSLDPTHAASFASPSSSVVKKNTSGRGRGRPRKYFPNGKITLGSSLDPTHAATFASPSSSAVKKNTSIRGKGKPRGSFKKKLPIEMSGVTNGSGFSPHVIIVNRGEDIVAKVGAFCQGGPNTDMCILSAHGLVGNAALYQSGSVVTYEGRFEIISLSGNLEVSDNTTTFKKMSYFKVSLEGQGSRLLAGVVADKLIAASLVKITIGVFTLDCKKASSNYLKLGSSSVPPSQIAAFGTLTSDAYQGPSSDSSGDNDNIPFNQLPGIYNNATHPIPTMSMYQELWDRQTQQ